MKKAFVGVLLSAGLFAGQTLAEAEPNIVLILSDDQDASTLEYMPEVDSLAAQGLTFRRFYITNSVCSPSRATILRGQYAHNHGVLDNSGPDGGVRAYVNKGNEVDSLPVWLSTAGYRTALVGKYFNGYGTDVQTTYVPPGWTDWYAKMNGGVGYDTFALNENGEVVDYTDTHELDVLAEKATDFIRDAATRKEPFYLYFAPFSPHANNKIDPPTPPERYAGTLADAEAPRSAAFNEIDTSDKPPWVRNHAPLTADEIAAIDQLYRSTAEVVRGLDDAVEAITAALADAGISEETYVFYVSDNGFLFGQHRLTGKGKPYEENSRFPLIVRGPGIEPNRTTDLLAGNIDLASTFLDLAGVARPSLMDGRSLVPILHDDLGTEQWRNAILLENWKQADPPADLTAVFNTRSIRSERYKYNEYNGPDELYLMSSDPQELVNQYSNVAPDLVSRFESWIEFYYGCAGPECRALDLAPGACGNGAQEEGETCDDGNRDDGDGCSALCMSELCGDANGDFDLNLSDALYVLSVAIGGRACSGDLCDVDGNGTVTVTDAFTLLDKLVGAPRDLVCWG